MNEGVYIGTSGNQVGGSSRAAANIIAFNRMDGVEVWGLNNFILGNSIFSNAGLGIDLFNDGVTPNDGPGDADTNAPNNFQNFPVLSSAKTTLRATTIKGTLESTQNATFTIQFFSNPTSTKEEGKKFIGQKVVSDTAGDGIMPFTFKPQKKVKAGLFVTATATGVSTADTSEFSAPKKVQ